VEKREEETSWENKKTGAKVEGGRPMWLGADRIDIKFKPTRLRLYFIITRNFYSAATLKV